MKIGAETESNMLNLMVMFICPVLDEIHLSWVNLVENTKTLYLT